MGGVTAFTMRTAVTPLLILRRSLWNWHLPLWINNGSVARLSEVETRRARLLEQLENRNAQTPHQGHHQVRRWEQRQARRQNAPSSATMPRGSSSRQTRSSLSRLDFRKGSRKRPTSPPPSSTPDASSSSLTTESSPLITPSSKAVPHEAQDAVMQEPPSFSNNESSASSTG